MPHLQEKGEEENAPRPRIPHPLTPLSRTGGETDSQRSENRGTLVAAEHLARNAAGSPAQEGGTRSRRALPQPRRPWPLHGGLSARGRGVSPIPRAQELCTHVFAHTETVPRKSPRL